MTCPQVFSLFFTLALPPSSFFSLFLTPALHSWSFFSFFFILALFFAFLFAIPQISVYISYIYKVSCRLCSIFITFSHFFRSFKTYNPSSQIPEIIHIRKLIKQHNFLPEYEKNTRQKNVYIHHSFPTFPELDKRVD